MCDYISKNELCYPRDVFNDWIKKVQKNLKREYGLTFSYLPIGSGARNMVIRKCNSNLFDLDFQIELQKMGDIDINDCKAIKNHIRNAFDSCKPTGFTNCEDSTQALTTKNNKDGFGYDIIITVLFENEYYILRNNKNSNGNNNNDYGWYKQSELKEFREKMDLIEGAEMWNDLRDRYKNKRHNSRNNNKKSYQILNEALSETLDYFDVDY